jgi:hypothetical protein
MPNAKHFLAMSGAVVWIVVCAAMAAGPAGYLGLLRGGDHLIAREGDCVTGLDRPSVMRCEDGASYYVREVIEHETRAGSGDDCEAVMNNAGTVFSPYLFSFGMGTVYCLGWTSLR